MISGSSKFVPLPKSKRTLRGPVCTASATSL